MNRKTVLVLAYSVSPIRGSEYSVGWNYIREMSKDHNLIVLYGLAGDHMGDLEEVAMSKICQDMPNVEWVPVRPNRIARLLNTPNQNGFLVYSFYLAYKFWHLQSYQFALGLVKSRKIDLIHYLCPIGYREPGFLWKIDKPYIWGPVSGMQNRSFRLAFGKGLKVGCKIALRNIINSIQFRFSHRVKTAFARTDVLIAATSGVQNRIFDVHHFESELFTENGITDLALKEQRLVQFVPGSSLNIIWVGSNEERKSLDILLKALSSIKVGRWHLYVIGVDAIKSTNINLAHNLGISGYITWVGKVPREHVNNFYRKAHVHVITSMLEGNPTVIWEAMSFGIPTVTLDHFGMHDVVCEKCGLRVPVTSTLKSLTNNLAQSLTRLITEPNLVSNLSGGVLECSQRYLWTKRREQLNYFYDLAIKRRASRLLEN